MPTQEQIQDFAKDCFLTPYCNGSERTFSECVGNVRNMRIVFEYFLDYDDMREKWWNIAIPDLAGVPLEVANMAYDRAHADGHANVYREVANRMIDEFDYAKRLIELSKK